jgi:serine/threonine protein kinase/WD40 repeat protein
MAEPTPSDSPPDAPIQQDRPTLAPPDTDSTFEAWLMGKPLSVPLATLSLPDFDLLEELGRGGMGVVRRAFQKSLHRHVAIKWMRYWNGPGSMATRFEIEAEAIAAIDHPHVVKIHSAGSTQGVAYLVMELLMGGSLADRIRQHGRLPAHETALLLIQLAEAIQAAHDVGVVHRDLKPLNVLFDSRGEPRVTDFGLAKFRQRDLTHTNDRMGTPAYMAPEQAHGDAKSTGPAVDIYALGVVLYECLTGKPPFEGPEPMSVLRRILDEEPIPPRQRVADIPSDLECICLKCLAKDPRKRYVSAAALADDLRRFLAGEPVSVRPPGTLEKLLKWARRHPTRASILVLASLMTLLIGGVTLVYQDRVDQQRRLAALIKASNLRLNARPGWTWEAADQIRLARSRFESTATLDLLRSEWIATELTADVRLLGTWQLFPGDPAELHEDDEPAEHMAHHPTEPLIALGLFGFDDKKAKDDLTVLLLDTRTGKRLQTLLAPACFDHLRKVGNTAIDSPSSLVFSPDGRWLLLATRQGFVHRWDLQNLAKPRLQSWRMSLDAVSHLAFVGTGQTFIGRAGDEMFEWSLETGRPQLHRHLGPHLLHVASVPTVDKVYVKENAQMRVLDPGDFSDLAPSFPVETQDTLNISPDGRLGVVGRGTKLQLVDLFSGEVVGELNSGPRPEVFRGAVFSSDGRFVLAVRPARGVLIFDVGTGQPVANLPLSDAVSYRDGIPVAFSPDGSFVYIGGRNVVRAFELRAAYRALVVQPQPFERLGSFAHSKGLLTHTNLKRSGLPDTSEMALWSSDAPLAPPRRQRTHLERLDGLAARPRHRSGGPLLGFASTWKTWVWNLEAENLRELPAALNDGGLREVQSFAFVNDRLWLSGAAATRFRLDDLKPDGVTFADPEVEINRKQAAAWFVASSDRYTLIGSALGHFALLDTAGQTCKKWDRQQSLPSCLQFAPDQQRVLIASVDGELVLHDPFQKEPLAQWKAHAERPTTLVWIDDQTLVTGSLDKTVAVWRLDPMPREVLRLPMADEVRDVVYLPSGELAVLEKRSRMIKAYPLARLLKSLGAERLGVDLPLPPKPPADPTERFLEKPSEKATHGMYADFYWTAKDRPDLRGWCQRRIVPEPRLPTPPEQSTLFFPPSEYTLQHRGWLVAPTPGNYKLHIEVNGTAEINLDGKRVGQVKNGQIAWEVDLIDQPHRLRIDYTHTGGPHLLRVNWSKPKEFDPRPLGEALYLHKQDADKATPSRRK